MLYGFMRLCVLGSWRSAHHPCHCDDRRHLATTHPTPIAEFAAVLHLASFRIDNGRNLRLSTVEFRHRSVGLTGVHIGATW